MKKNKVVYETILNLFDIQNKHVIDNDRFNNGRLSVAVSSPKNSTF